LSQRLKCAKSVKSLEKKRPGKSEGWLKITAHFEGAEAKQTNPRIGDEANAPRKNR